MFMWISHYLSLCMLSSICHFGYQRELTFIHSTAHLWPCHPTATLAQCRVNGSQYPTLVISSIKSIKGQSQQCVCLPFCPTSLLCSFKTCLSIKRKTVCLFFFCICCCYEYLGQQDGVHEGPSQTKLMCVHNPATVWHQVQQLVSYNIRISIISSPDNLFWWRLTGVIVFNSSVN